MQVYLPILYIYSMAKKDVNRLKIMLAVTKERILDKYDIACELVAFRIFLFNNAIYLLPYTGVGSGIQKYKKVNKR